MTLSPFIGGRGDSGWGTRARPGRQEAALRMVVAVWGSGGAVIGWRRRDRAGCDTGGSGDRAWSIPAPRHPVADAPRRSSPHSGDAAAAGGVERLVAELLEVAVWTSQDGAWQEHATLLLGTGDGHWEAVGFSEPAAAVLIPKLCELPGFNVDLLLELIGSRERRVVSLWHRVPDRAVRG